MNEAKINKIRNEEGREPLCLVMCGGSARAFCHVGVLKAMEQNNIVPDFIIANSMGSVIGMLYAYGFSPEKIEEIKDCDPIQEKIEDIQYNLYIKELKNYLPPSETEVFECVVVKGLSTDETSDTLHISKNLLGVRIFRMKQHIKNFLEDKKKHL